MSETTHNRLDIDPDGPGYFECARCSIAWHGGTVNPAPLACPNCGQPWTTEPLFVPHDTPPPSRRRRRR